MADDPKYPSLSDLSTWLYPRRTDVMTGSGLQDAHTDGKAHWKSKFSWMLNFLVGGPGTLDMSSFDAPWNIIKQPESQVGQAILRVSAHWARQVVAYDELSFSGSTEPTKYQFLDTVRALARATTDPEVLARLRLEVASFATYRQILMLDQPILDAMGYGSLKSLAYNVSDYIMKARSSPPN